MKKTVGIISFALLTACAGTQKHPSAPIGFRGAVLGGAPLHEMQLLEKWKPELGISSREITDAYVRPNESTSLGDLFIRDVTYQYFDKRLFHIEVNLWTERQKRCPNVKPLLGALESQFGIFMTRHYEDFVKNRFHAQWRSPEARVTYICFPESSINSIVIDDPSVEREVDARLKALRTAIEGRATERIKGALQK